MLGDAKKRGTSAGRTGRNKDFDSDDDYVSWRGAGSRYACGAEYDLRNVEKMVWQKKEAKPEDGQNAGLNRAALVSPDERKAQLKNG